jgi:heterodisulfide reductase subunit C
MNDDRRSFTGKITYNYKFIFNNGGEKEFNIDLDRVTFNLIQTGDKAFPEWTKLSCFKCPNCILDERQYEFCPIAVNMVDIIDYFSNFVSHEPVEVIVTAQERKYIKRVTLQHGVSSLIGIYMVTGGCPIMEKLKPMVRFHLPFATIEETKYRAISMYLLAQYFLYQRDSQPDWDLKKLAETYENIRIVNESFCKRLRTIEGKDANLNAVVVLDIFADSVNFSIDSRMVDDLDYLFKGYLK